MRLKVHLCNTESIPAIDDIGIDEFGVWINETSNDEGVLVFGFARGGRTRTLHSPVMNFC